MVPVADTQIIDLPEGPVGETLLGHSFATFAEECKVLTIFFGRYGI